MFIFENIDSLFKTINRTDRSQKFIMLVSNSDTIRHPLYFELTSHIKETKNMHKISTRKITTDEANAIKNSHLIK
jgi:hypothetical protein